MHVLERKPDESAAICENCEAIITFKDEEINRRKVESFLSKKLKYIICPVCEEVIFIGYE